jgi:Cu-Zn family superoxide dismutase
MRTAPLLVLPILALAACATGGASPSDRAQSVSSGSTAIARVRDASGRELGTLTLRETAAGISTTGTLRGIAPGVHGIHLHTTGRCDAPFTTAGGHWNPTMHKHGFDNPQGPHLGDMRNVDVGSDSVATVSTTSAGGSLRGAGGLLDTDGAAVVVHAGPDDYRTDPAGNSGARVACGVVTP